MTANVRFGKYAAYSGPYAISSIQIPIPMPPRSEYHVDRAYWLTTKVETCGTFGSVNAYDGTGMTAGPDQHIAVFPSELAAEDFNAEDDQGSLWELLRQLEMVQGTASYQAAFKAISDALAAKSLYLSQDGKLRYSNNLMVPVGGKHLAVKAGATAHGAYIRNILTPPDGKVPAGGAEWVIAAKWAELFSELFSHPDGHKAQLEFGKNHLVARTKNRKFVIAGKPESLEVCVYQQELTSTRVGLNGWTAALDLALSMFQSHSVNAPAIAAKILQGTCNGVRPGLTTDFATQLVARLGKSTYGQWNVIASSSRYQRTRTHAMASGLWPKVLFEGPGAVMPKALK